MIWILLALAGCTGETQTTTIVVDEGTPLTKAAMACEDQGVGRECMVVVELLQAKAPPDEEGVCAYAARGCAGGAVAGCALEGHCLVEGIGGLADVGAGVDLLLVACQKGVAEACTEAITVLREGRPGFPADPERVKGLLEEGCKAGVGEACRELGGQ